MTYGDCKNVYRISTSQEEVKVLSVYFSVKWGHFPPSKWPFLASSGLVLKLSLAPALVFSLVCSNRAFLMRYKRIVCELHGLLKYRVDFGLFFYLLFLMLYTEWKRCIQEYIPRLKKLSPFTPLIHCHGLSFTTHTLWTYQRVLYIEKRRRGH